MLSSLWLVRFGFGVAERERRCLWSSLLSLDSKRFSAFSMFVTRSSMLEALLVGGACTLHTA